MWRGWLVADRTHYEGCWRVHHECAVAEVERLRADAREAARLLARAEAVREGLHALRDRAERLEAENADLRESCAMACERPADDCGCAGCLYAAEVRARQEVGDDG